MSHDSECKVGNPTHIPRHDSLRGAKLQKNIDVGKFWGEKLSRKLILQGKYEKTRSLRLRVGELCHGLDGMLNIANCDLESYSIISQ